MSVLSDFLAGVKSTSEKAKEGAKKVSSYLPNAGDFAQPSKATAIPGITSGAKLVKDLAVGTARLPVTLPTKAMLTFQQKQSYTPVTGLEKFLVGNAPVTSYTADQDSIQKWAKDNGLSGNQAIAIGAIGAIGEAGLDFFTGGKGKTVNTIADLAKANTASKVSKIAKQANLPLSKETFELLAKESDPIKISKILNIGIEDSNFRRSVAAGLSQRAAQLEKEIAIANQAPVLDFAKIAKLEQEKIDIPKMMKDLPKMDKDSVFEMNKFLNTRNIDAFKINEQGIASGSLPGRIELPTYTKGSIKTDSFFKKSEKQTPVVSKGGTNFELGTFGENNANKKIAQVDRFAKEELADSIKNVKKAYRASDDPSNYRYDNIAWISEMKNGEKRVIYTRKNKNGAEEIINWHKINETKNPNYIKQLESFGSPDGNRTHILDLEGQRSNPLAYGAKSSIAEKEAKVNKTLKGFVGGGKLPKDAPAQKVIDFIKGKKEKKPSATEVVVSLLKEKKKTTTALKKIEDQLAPIVEGKTVMKEFSDDVARETFNEKIYQGIKNSPFFRKEGDIKDIMGEGFLMKKGDRYVVATSADATALEMKGYERLMEIDSFANAAGFENGEEYLRAVLKAGEDLKPVDLMRKELESIPEAKSYIDKLKDISGKLKESFDLKSLRTGINVGKELKQEKLTEFLKGLKSRQSLVAAVQKFFGLSDKDMLQLGARKNFANMTQSQFDNFLKNLEPRAMQYAERAQARAQVVDQIQRKELLKVDNLRKAMELPPINKMTTKQLYAFDKALEPFMKGDEFLSVRKLETVNNTELAGISTFREARERLAKRLGMNPDELNNLKATAIDRFRYDTALAEKNPFYKMLVDDTNRELFTAEARFMENEKSINKLIKDARSSRPISIVDRLIPTDKRIFEYLDSSKKSELAKKMTDKELVAAEYIRKQYEVMRDYLVSKKQLNNMRENYITHTRMGFLETWKEKGIIKAFSDSLDSMKEDEAIFNILAGDTGEILPLEKFFKFSMRRSGEIDPSKNVAKAFLEYSSAFEKKRALDSLIPKISIYTDSLTPKNLTPRGLEMDRSLKNFVNTWLNTKKGRVVDLSGVVPQGGKLDSILKAGVAFTRVIDLGLNIPIGLASQGGEQMMNLTMLGAKNYAKGTYRMNTSQGKKILENYKNFVGRTPWDSINDASKNIAEKTETALFGLFQDASVRANKQFLLGSLSDKEFASGVISAEKLAIMKREMGRYRVTNASKSIVGATSPGAVFTQYKSWAIPPLRTTLDNLEKIAKSPSKVFSREGQETLRSAVILSTIYLAGASILEDKNKKGKSFMDELKTRVVQDSMTLIGAMDPTLWSKAPRLMGFATDLATSMKLLFTLEEYKRDSGLNKEGELKFDNKLFTTLVPKAIKSRLNQKDDFQQYTSEKNDAEQQKRDDFRPTYKEIRSLTVSGKKEEALEKFNKLSNEEHEMYEGMKKAEKAKNSTKLHDLLDYKPSEAVKFVRSLDSEEQKRLIQNMSKKEYELYSSGK